MGGNIVNVYKNKGPIDECDSSRGILLADHMGKSLCEQLDAHLRPRYNIHMPTDQFGATSGKGTDFASHIVRSFIDMCNALSLSFFILIVDLVKAFDRIVRELVLGWPPGVTDPVQHLTTLGLTAPVVRQTVLHRAKGA